MRSSEFRACIPGFALVILLSAAAWTVSLLYSAVGSLVIAIITGMVARAAIGDRPLFRRGLDASVSVLIPVGIIFYGSHLEFAKLTHVPSEVWLEIVVGITVVILLVCVAGSRLKLARPLSLLIGVGTAICGASAIVITAPVLKAERDEMAKAILVITILGLAGMLFWPFLGGWLGFSVERYAEFCAVTLQQTGFVKAAALSRGSECLDFAMIIKSARIVSIIPLILVAGTLSRIRTLEQASKPGGHLDIHIPWFLWAFVIAGLGFSFVQPLASVAPHIKPAAALIWTVAMASIGMSVDVRKVANSLGRPLLLGLIVWIALAGVFIVSALC